MRRFVGYTWRGERINDGREWARMRGEKIVNYRHTVTYQCPFTGKVHVNTFLGSMPESFWHTLKVGSNERFEEIKEENN